MNSAMAVSNKAMSKITIQARMRIIPVLDLQFATIFTARMYCHSRPQKFCSRNSIMKVRNFQFRDLIYVWATPCMPLS